MHGETAAAASFSRRLVKEKSAGRDLNPVIDRMNEKEDPFCLEQGYSPYNLILFGDLHGE
jgi:hypothetical protein